MRNIKHIPTTYCGVNMRSRLEARWADLFTQFGWRWNYEPLDFDGWIPDFVMRSNSGVSLECVYEQDYRGRQF
jgi:hypothetical protein